MKKSTQIRFGRDGDLPTLLEGISVFGWRHLTGPVLNVIKPHTLPGIQIFMAIEGGRDIWVSGKLWYIGPGEIMFIQPYETIALPGNSIPPGEHCFLQLDRGQIEFDKSYPPEIGDICLELAELKSQSFPFDPRLLHLFKGILHEHQNVSRWSVLYCRQYLIEIMTIFIELAEGKVCESPLVQQVRNLISTKSPSSFRVKEMALACGLSEQVFRRRFIEQRGCCPHQFLQVERFCQARGFLIEGKKTLLEISDDLRFRSVQHFSLFIKEVTGIPPSRYRKILQEMLCNTFLSSISGRIVSKDLDREVSG